MGLFSGAGVWALVWLRRGWIPHDDGALAQSAERVLAGQIPHADFTELYTGGLTYLHAAAFGLFGARLSILRYVLFVAFLLWVPVVWFVARRLGAPKLAGLTTCLAVVMSIPNYSASLPSWYLMFLATGAIGALIRHTEGGGMRWLFIAGLCAGVSTVIKISGIALLGALLLWLAYVEQSHNEGDTATLRATGRADRLRLGSVLITALSFVLCWLLFRLIHRFPGPSQVTLFVVPGGSLALLIAFRDWRSAQPTLLTRVRWHLPRLSAVLAGVLLPILAFVGYFYVVGELESLFRGVLVAPATRFASASVPPPPLFTAVFLLIPLLILRFDRVIASSRPVLVGTGLVLSTIVVASWVEPLAYAAAWFALSWSIPPLVLWGVYRFTARGPEVGFEEIPFALLSVVAFLGLVQFPFSAPVYFLYVAPVVALSLLGVSELRSRGSTSGVGVALVSAFFLAFVATSVTPHSRVFGWRTMSIRQAVTSARGVPLGLPRGGIRVSQTEAEVYSALVALIERESGSGGLWAGPDSPEVYFLSDRTNHTPHLFEFLDGDVDVTPFLDGWSPDVIVVNQIPDFTDPVGPEVLSRIRSSYAENRSIGRFQVFWSPINGH